MRLLIIGAGGIGCYYGARLEAAGHAVCYVARGAHLSALQTDGLEVTHKDFKFLNKVDALDLKALQTDKACSNFDWLILAAKSGATQSITDELHDWLTTADTPILSLQNGVDNEPILTAALGEGRVYGGLAVRIGGHLVSPGKVEATGPGQVILGVWPHTKDQSENLALNELSGVLNRAHIPTQVSDDIQWELWRKLIINNGVNPLSALTGLDTQSLTTDPIFARTVYKMMAEVASVSTADNIELSTADVDEMFELICGFAAIKTSMLVDKEKGRPLELDSISGAVISRAECLGVEVPVTALIHRLLLLSE